MSEANTPVVPEGSTVSASADSIEFTTPDGKKGEVTEFGSVIHEETAPSADVSAETATDPQDKVDPAPEVNNAGDFHGGFHFYSNGKHGKIPKEKK